MATVLTSRVGGLGCWWAEVVAGSIMHGICQRILARSQKYLGWAVSVGLNHPCIDGVHNAFQKAVPLHYHVRVVSKDGSVTIQNKLDMQ